MGHAARMHAVALARSIRQEWRVECQSDRAAQGCRDPLNVAQAESGRLPALEAGNRSLGDTSPASELALRPSNRKSRVPDDAGSIDREVRGR